MSREETFQMLLEHTQEELTEVTRALGQAYQKLIKETQQGELLESFLSEYQDRLNALSRSGVSIAGIMNFNEFLNKISSAIVHQAGMSEEAEREVERVRQKFLALTSRVRSFEILIQKLVTERQKKDAKKEQALSDAYALHLHLKNQSSGDMP